MIAATKTSLAAMVKAGQFREDLYYRLNVVPLWIPPLRERPQDIPPLVDYFLEKLALQMNRGHLVLSPGALGKLQGYSWPGNVRELEHVLERMAALADSDLLDEKDVPQLSPTTGPPERVLLVLSGADRIEMSSMLDEVEARLIRWALERSEGNLAQAAERLGIPRSTLQYKVGKLRAVISGSARDA